MTGKTTAFGVAPRTTPRQFPKVIAKELVRGLVIPTLIFTGRSINTVVNETFFGNAVGKY